MSDAKNRLPKRVRPGDVDALRRKIWRAILAAELLLEHAEPDIRLRAVNAIGQTGNTYRGILELADLEARVAALEASAEQSQP